MKNRSSSKMCPTAASLHHLHAQAHLTTVRAEVEENKVYVIEALGKLKCKLKELALCESMAKKKAKVLSKKQLQKFAKEIGLDWSLVEHIFKHL
ncbi:MAG: hypothetical protein WC761_02400 [Candidatus Paceibacterota bacterium]|jgi:hypothetical protein